MPTMPVHGFVLAGGQSSRMGADKALLSFRGQPMIKLAAAKLRTFCAQVSIAGNRDDLSFYAPVVREQRIDIGPAAGVEMGLSACTQPWALFIPVDAPLVPPSILQRFAKAVLQDSASGIVASHLAVGGRQPAFCMVRRIEAGSFSEAVETGERRLARLLAMTAGANGFRTYGLDDLYAKDEVDKPTEETARLWFANVNTPDELRAAEVSAAMPY